MIFFNPMMILFYPYFSYNEMGNIGSLNNSPKVGWCMIGFEARQSAQKMFSVLHFISLLR